MKIVKGLVQDLIKNGNTNTDTIKEANTIEDVKKVTVDNALKSIIQNGGAMFE
jgi:hypothetical protein